MSVRPTAPPDVLAARRLISINDLSDADIEFILDLADHYAGYLRRSQPAPKRLAGKTQVNLFFEDSTRTNLSFELAGKKLGADVINVPVAASSVHKGETQVDTAQTMAAMAADVMVVRAKEEALHYELDEVLPCALVNGGAGKSEHPTQALLDAAAIRSEFGALEGLVVAICGDIRHSRVAGSDARLFQRLGAVVRFVGPSHLMPDEGQFTDIPRINNLKDGLGGADIVMGLRMQFERFPSNDDQGTMADRFNEDQRLDFFNSYGLSHETIKFAKPGARVMHPGPMNRGVEIDGALADDKELSLVLRQVFYGVPTRMACLDALLTRGE